MTDMTDWVDFSVHATFLGIVWFGAPAIHGRLVQLMAADRNPGWAATNAAIAMNPHAHRWFRRVCGVVGSLSLCSLLACQLGFWPAALSAPAWEPASWMVLRDLTAASAIPGGIFICGYTLWLGRRLRTQVPLAERRSATLERRSIDDFVPRGARLAIYGLVVTHLTAWLGAGVLGWHKTPAFWGTLVFQFVVSAAFFAVPQLCVRRRPGIVDRVHGPEYRRGEVRFAFAAQLFPIVNGAARLYEETATTVPYDVARISQLAVVLFVVLLFVRVVWASASGSGPRSPEALNAM
jgi:hypothetical protein